MARPGVPVAAPVAGLEDLVAPEELADAVDSAAPADPVDQAFRVAPWEPAQGAVAQTSRACRSISPRTTGSPLMDRTNYAAEEYYADEDHYANFITFDNIKNAWVRNCAALHFVYSMVGTQRGSKWITVQDCVSREPHSRPVGARRFTFAWRGPVALVQRCHAVE